MRSPFLEYFSGYYFGFANVVSRSAIELFINRFGQKDTYRLLLDGCGLKIIYRGCLANLLAQKYVFTKNDIEHFRELDKIYRKDSEIGILFRCIANKDEQVPEGKIGVLKKIGCNWGKGNSYLAKQLKLWYEIFERNYKLDSDYVQTSTYLLNRDTFFSSRHIYQSLTFFLRLPMVSEFAQENTQAVFRISPDDIKEFYKRIFNILQDEIENKLCDIHFNQSNNHKASVSIRCLDNNIGVSALLKRLREGGIVVKDNNVFYQMFEIFYRENYNIEVCSKW